MKSLYQLSARDMHRHLSSGQCSSYDLISSCLNRIKIREPHVGAWAHINNEHVFEQARQRDREKSRSVLHGIPIGVKDIINTVEMPTRYGSETFEVKQSAKDAQCIRLLKDAGAVILGKTVTTEFAYYKPGKTANPHNCDYTPGGSSSGSAAAVADFHVPLSLGTQTAGSIIRPASFCGVVGFKPTFDSWPLTGVHPLSKSMDTLGAFANCVSDIQVLHSILKLKGSVKPKNAFPPKIAVVKGPYWKVAEQPTKDTLQNVLNALSGLGLSVTDLGLLKAVDGINEAQTTVMASETNTVFTSLYGKDKGKLSKILQEFIAFGSSRSENEIALAYQIIDKSRKEIRSLFKCYDIVLTPAAIGTAPAGLDSTGNPAFNRLWTATGNPCLTLPVMKTKSGLPVGIQLVADHAHDDFLLEIGIWLEEILS